MLPSLWQERSGFVVNGGPSCQRMPSVGECRRFLSQINTLFDLDNESKSHVNAKPNKLAMALMFLQEHNGFTFTNGFVSKDGEDESEVVVTSRTAEENQLVELHRSISHRIGRLLLTAELYPFVMAPKPLLEPGNMVPAVLAFECYCRLIGSDAACAAVRDQRANWLHAEIGGTLNSVTSSRNNAPSVRSSGFHLESPDNIIKLIDRISLQCDCDLAVVVQVAGRPKWRQFAELYQTAATDAAVRVKQQAINFLQASSSDAHTHLSRWLLACLRAEQLRSRESFLHQVGQCVSVRPKSGSLLKASSRPYSGDTDPSPFVSSTNNSVDALLIKLFSDAIASIFLVSSNEDFTVDEGVAVSDVLPVSCQIEPERWPRTISKSCWGLWDIFGTFIQLFFVEMRHHSNSQQAVLDTIGEAVKSYISSRAQGFSSFISSDFARHEQSAYLVISDLSYLERQLHSLKSVLTSTFSGNVIQRSISDMREFVRSQLDAMHARIIAIHARLLLESLLHDWRQVLVDDVTGGENGPAAALVAWALHLGLWYQRMSLILPIANMAHIYLSVVLASFERITARLVNSNNLSDDSKLRNINVALRLAVNLLFVVVKTPELIGSNFASTFSTTGINCADSPSDFRDLVAGFNALANALVDHAHKIKGSDFRSDSPTSWITHAFEIRHAEISRLTKSDLFLLFMLLVYKIHPNSHLTTIRVACSTKTMRHVIDLFVDGPDNDQLMVLFSLIKAASSTNVEPFLLGSAIWCAVNSSSSSNDRQRACMRLHEMLVDDICRQSQCLQLAFNRCRLRHDSSALLQSLPCSCLSLDGNATDDAVVNFINSLPVAIESLDLSVKLAMGVVDKLNGGSSDGSGLNALVSMIIRKCIVAYGDPKEPPNSYYSGLLEVADHLSNSFEEPIDASLSSSSASSTNRRRRRQANQHVSQRHTSRLDEHLIPVLASIRKVTTEKLPLIHDIHGNYSNNPNATADEDHIGTAARDVMLNEAVALELLAAVYSVANGLESLLRMEASLASRADRLLFNLFKESVGFPQHFDDQLAIAKTALSGNTTHLATCILSTARQSFKSGFDSHG